MRSTFTNLLAFAIPFVVAASGCHCGSKVPLVRTIPLVDVGGIVKSPGPIEIPPEGLTLLQSFIRAGGLPQEYSRFENASSKAISELFVRLQRGREAHHFPLKMVETDLAGIVQLAPGDIVQVVLAKNTSLFPTVDVDRNLEMTFDGFHQLSGNITPNQLDKLIPADKRSLVASLLTNEVPKLAPVREGVQAPVVLLTRADPSNGYMVDHFVLPTAFYNGFSPGNRVQSQLLGDVLSSRLDSQVTFQGGDQYLFTRLDSVPIVGASLLAPALKRALERDPTLMNSDHHLHRTISNNNPQQLPIAEVNRPIIR